MRGERRRSAGHSGIDNGDVDKLTSSFVQETAVINGLEDNDKDTRRNGIKSSDGGRRNAYRRRERSDTRDRLHNEYVMVFDEDMGVLSSAVTDEKRARTDKNHARVDEEFPSYKYSEYNKVGVGTDDDDGEEWVVEV